MLEKDRLNTTTVIDQPLNSSSQPDQHSVAEPEIEPSSAPANAAEVVKNTKKREKLSRYILLFLALILIGIGYLKRESLLQFIETNFGANVNPVEPSKAMANDKIKVLYWQDPMHPAYISDKPGKAPDCGMDLIPVYEENSKTSEITKNLPPGAFNISFVQQQLIGVQFGKVTFQHVSKTLRAVGKLAYDETKIARIHTKTDGWIENVFADFTGKQIKKGEPLISVYSPDLYQTEQEYLLAIKGRKELGQTDFPQAVAASESLYQSAKRRLELWDISEEQIKEIEKKGAPIKTLTVYAPVDGFVLTRNAYPKQRIIPDTELYTIADLSTIWVIADIYEYEALEVKVGQSAIVTLSYFPGHIFKGQISYIYPQLDSATRTLKVRIEIPNSNYELKPDMFANVELKIDYGRQLVIPQESVLDSGSEQTVFIALGNGYFQPRKVQLGAKLDNNFIVESGLKAGEQVVTSANFLIDSESRLRSATAGMGAGHAGHSGITAPSKSSEDLSQHQQNNSPIKEEKNEKHAH